MWSVSIYSKGIFSAISILGYSYFSKLEPETNELMRQARIKRDKTSQMTIRESKLMVMSIVRLILYLSERQLMMDIVLKQPRGNTKLQMAPIGARGKTDEELIIDAICVTQDSDSERPFEQIQAAIIADKTTSKIFYSNENGILAHWVQFANELSSDTSYQSFIQSEIEHLYSKLGLFGISSRAESASEVVKMEE